MTSSGRRGGGAKLGTWSAPSTYLAWKPNIGHVDLAEPIPLQVKPQSMFHNLKARIGHGHVAVDSIKKKNFVQVPV